VDPVAALRIFAACDRARACWPVLAEKAIDVIPTVMFMVGWMRLVLLGPERIERLPGPAGRGARPPSWST
jgi:hypothetical protein